MYIYMDKFIFYKNKIIKKSNSTMYMKSIMYELIDKSQKILKKLINQESQKGDIFYNFKIGDNKLIILAASYFVSCSYKFLKKNNGKFISHNKLNKERIFADFAEKIYQKILPAGLIKLFKQTQENVLVPAHAIFKNDKTKSIILAIRGTVSLTDAIIDGLTTVEPVYLHKKKYWVHSGFLRASKHIADERYELINKLLKENPDYELVITGHSLGGATAVVTGVLLFDKYFNRNTHVNIYGFGSSTSFAAEKNGNPLEKYLNDNDKLKIKTFIYENDIIPRLSAFEIFVFLASCVAVCKLIFLNQKVSLFGNFHLSQKTRDDFFKHNPKTKNAINSSKLIGKIARSTSNLINKSGKKIKEQVKHASNLFAKKEMNGGTDKSTDTVLKAISVIYKTIYHHFENKFKKNGDFFRFYTSHPGIVYYIKNENIFKINPQTLHAEFNFGSVKDHLMGNYINSLKKHSNKIKTAKKPRNTNKNQENTKKTKNQGNTKKRKTKKTRKTKK